MKPFFVKKKFVKSFDNNFFSLKSWWKNKEINLWLLRKKILVDDKNNKI